MGIHERAILIAAVGALLSCSAGSAPPSEAVELPRREPVRLVHDREMERADHVREAEAEAVAPAVAPALPVVTLAQQGGGQGTNDNSVLPAPPGPSPAPPAPRPSPTTPTTPAAWSGAGTPGGLRYDGSPAPTVNYYTQRAPDTSEAVRSMSSQSITPIQPSVSNLGLTPWTFR
jgi:hypothetical protein